MAATKTNFAPPPSFILSPHQQDLLFAALNSNNKASATQSLAPGAFDHSPLQAPPSATLTNLDDSPFIDYDYDFDNDGSFGDYDFSNLPQGQMIGNLPGASSSDGDVATHDKRGHSDDDDNDEEPDGKRREGDDKLSKKPGRKPLTSEPTTKRKAQNRAAQRAFRERKEKHLKDLETKVQDLEKASESANHENLILRSKVEKMAAELKEYKKRVGSQPTNAMPGLPSYLKGPHVNNPNDVDFSFEFPKFGQLPGPPASFSKSDSQLPKSRSTTSPTGPSRATSFASNISPLDASHPTMSFGANRGPPTTQDMSQFSGIFTHSLDGASNTFDYLAHMSNSDATRSSTDSTNAATSTGHNTSHSSPASSNSNTGLTSSCGTSPEPYTQSPAAPKPDANSVLTTIGEETDALATENDFCLKLSHVCGNPSNPVPRTMSDLSPPQQHSAAAAVPSSAFDLASLDWLAQQNGNQFDPQLFGDYREPQDNVLAGGLYDDTFFNEAFALPGDFAGSPFTLEAGVLPAAAAAAGAAVAAGGHPPKRDLLGEIDAKLEEEEVVPAESEMLTCTNMWEKIQSCPRVQNGEIDMDSLCTQLQQKAKCSGEGPVIQERDFKNVLNTMFLAKGLPLCDEQ